MWLEHHKALVRILLAIAATGMMAASRAATFGTVVPIGGQASDIALDEASGVLYIANFTAGRIDVLSLADNTIHSSIHVTAAPSSLALSPDGRYLVAAHFGNATPPASPNNALTILDFATGGRITLALGDPPLGVAFGADGLALVATTTSFWLLDPRTGRVDLLQTIAALAANTIPALPGTPPVTIVAAALAASGDGRYIFGLADAIRVMYDVAARTISIRGYTATPPLGPRVVTVSADGSYWAAGWALFNRAGVFQSQFTNASGDLGLGSLAIDSRDGIIYSQVPEANAPDGSPPILTISDADNLTVRERLYLPESLAGRGLLNVSGDVLYAVSESGVMILPVGKLNQTHRLRADLEDLVFHGNFCQHGAIARTLHLTDPGGGQTGFVLSTDMAGVSMTPSSGRTPATVQVLIDPAQFANQRGTALGTLTLSSAEAVNVAAPVRLLVNNQRPDERGSAIDIPGRLVDLLADPLRDRFYVLRQDRNQVLVMDGSGMSQLAVLRTGNTPTRMTITSDQKYLLVGHDDSQFVSVFDLDTLLAGAPVVFPPGHYPRSVAASWGAILAASRVAGDAHTIDRIDLPNRKAIALPSLGVFQNSVNQDTVLVASPNGSSVLGAAVDGNVLLYDAGTDTFTVSRKIAKALSGSYAASGDGQYEVGGNLLNASLVPVSTWSRADFPAGFAFVGGQGLQLSGPQGSSTGTGIVERIEGAASLRAMRVAEQPVNSARPSAFTRALAPLANGKAVVALTVSGVTALAWNFDVPVSPPRINSIVNAANLKPQVAAGSLISVFGTALNPTNIATSEIPLPTAIGESCLTLNGAPIPMMFASPSQINAQVPLHTEGRATVTLYTPGGASDDYFLNVSAVAPAVFLSGVAGPVTGIPVVVKDSNQQLVTASNPIHEGDVVTIYATGLGPTTPEIAAGLAAPLTPPALTLYAPLVTLGDAPLTISYAGLTPGAAGVYQITAQVPTKAPKGSQVPLTIMLAGATTSVAVRVVD
jgi:uncharacterized protein (TIGR03437 family)